MSQDDAPARTAWCCSSFAASFCSAPRVFAFLTLSSLALSLSGMFSALRDSDVWNCQLNLGAARVFHTIFVTARWQR